MSEQTDYWSGQGGTEYTKRNRVRWLDRVPFWTEIVAKTGVGSVLEVGCNFGANLLALRTVKPDISLAGVEINQSAVDQAHNCGLCDVSTNAPYFCFGDITIRSYRGSAPKTFDMVFTSGMLIHVPPKAIQETMRGICAFARDGVGRNGYVLAIEYEAAQEEEVTYRGQRGLLWKRPYGRMYEDLGLTEVDSGYLKPEDGWDNTTWWLLSKI